MDAFAWFAWSKCPVLLILPELDEKLHRNPRYIPILNDEKKHEPSSLARNIPKQFPSLNMSYVIPKSLVSVCQSPWGLRNSTAELLNFWSCHLMSRPLGCPRCRVPAGDHPVVFCAIRWEKSHLWKNFDPLWLDESCFTKFCWKFQIFDFALTLNSLRRT